MSDIRIVRGAPTPDEIAAVTAVLTAALDEAADENARLGAVTVSAWQRNQRALRSTLTPGPGMWRGFSG